MPRYSDDELKKFLRDNPDLTVVGSYRNNDISQPMPDKRDEEAYAHWEQTYREIDERIEVEKVNVYHSGKGIPHPQKRTEHSLQRAVIDECNRRGLQDERWNMVFAIPNGGMRDKATAGKLKAEGVKAGVPDLFIPIPRAATDTERAYHGAFIELKVGRNKPTENQERWIGALKEQGYAVSVIWDNTVDVMRWIEWYFAA